MGRTANIAWSPLRQVPIYLAAGTAAQQLGASFSFNSCLEIFGMLFSVFDNLVKHAGF